MRNALYVGLHDLRVMLRQRETLVWAFVMPVVFFYFIGTVTGGSGSGLGGGAEVRDPIEVVAAADSGFLVDELVRQLEDNDYAVTRVEAEASEGAPGESPGGAPKAASRVELPARFTERVLAGEVTQVDVHTDSEGLGGDYSSFRIQRAVYTLLASLVTSSEAGEEPSPGSFARLRDMPRALSVEVSSAGKRERIPQGYEQTIPGTLVMFTMIMLLTTGAVTLVIERREGLLRRLASAPMSRREVVAGKWIGLVSLGLVQLAAGMLLGTFLFGMDWGPDLPAVLGVLVLWAALVASLGILLGSFAKTEGQAVGIGVISSNVLAALGGCWWPIEITPGWLQQLAGFLPTGWAMDAMHQLAIFQNGPRTVLPSVALMVGATLAFGVLAAKRFRFH